MFALTVRVGLGHKRTSSTVVLTYHPQAKVFARMTSSIRTLNIKTTFVTESSTVSNNLAQIESAAHMRRQLEDLREKEMRIARCW